ncbi:hypothetical protein ACWCOW_33095, partial [Streptomyces sp. NPDC001939]
MPTRIFAVSAAMVGAAVLATGITYAAQSESTQAAPPAKQAAAPVKQDALAGNLMARSLKRPPVQVIRSRM